MPFEATDCMVRIQYTGSVTETDGVDPQRIKCKYISSHPYAARRAQQQHFSACGRWHDKAISAKHYRAGVRDIIYLV